MLVIIITCGTLQARDFYVNPFGNGDLCSSDSPCSVVQALNLVGAGDHILMQDGIYTGANGMLALPSGRSGTAVDRIKVSAINDGTVLINGEYIHIPVSLNANDYWTIEGINAANSSYSVINVNPLSEHNIFRRVCAWNADSFMNEDVWSVYGAFDTLLEDVCGFGSGRKIFQIFYSDSTIIRRAWGEWNYSTSTAGPEPVFNISYNSYRSTCENCIGTRDEEIVPVYPLAPIFSSDRIHEPLSCAVYGAYLGSIGYVLSGQIVNGNSNGLIFGPSDQDYLAYQDVVMVVSPQNPTSTTAINAQAYNNVNNPSCPVSASGSNRKLTNISIIGATSSNTIDTSSPNGWTVTNFHAGVLPLDVYGSQSLYVNDGTKGATICYRTVDGTLTSTPLWPWPMNQRIIGAMTAARRLPHDVTAEMETLFGPIPSACRNVDAPLPFPLHQTEAIAAP
jgi:hypothetical protein